MVQLYPDRVRPLTSLGVTLADYFGYRHYEERSDEESHAL